MRQRITFTLWAMLAVVAVALTIRVTAEEPVPAPSTQLLIYSGILRAVDLPGRTIIVDGSAVPAKFTVPTNVEIIVKDKPKGSLGDLMVGDGVQVKYTDDGDAQVAHQISLLSLKVP